MPNGANRITQLRQQLMEITKTPDALYVAEVVRVDGRVAMVQDVQSGRSIEVLLQAADATKGMLLIPAIGSWVLVAELDGGGSGVVVATEGLSGFEVEIGGSKLSLKDGEIAFNDGGLGGLVKVVELQNQLAKVLGILQALKQVVAVPVNEAGGGAPSGFQAALNTVLAGLSLPDFSNIENPNVKHG
jgi:hypothetical protein